MKGAISMKKHEIRYVKPNIGALKGPVGRSILETIRNTPRPDMTALTKEADAVLANLAAEKKKMKQ